MILTDFFEILNSNTQVKLNLGENPLRVYPYGTKINNGTKKPYALYGVFNSNPYNFLESRTDMDLSGIQVDIYAETSSKAISCFESIRTAVEKLAYIVSYTTPDIDIEDGLYHLTMEIDFHVER